MNKPHKFKKRPVIIEAIQYLPPDNCDDVHEFIGEEHYPESCGEDAKLAIETLEGAMVAEPGDWIIKGVAGEFYPCKPDIFDATYESVEGDLT